MKQIEIKAGTPYKGKRWNGDRLVTKIRLVGGKDSIVYWMNLETLRCGKCSLTHFAHSAISESNSGDESHISKAKVAANTERKEHQIASGNYHGGFSGPTGIPGAAEYPGSY